MEKNNDEKNILYVIAYVFEWLSGAIVYLISKDNERLKKHALQAILFGVISFLLSFIFSIISLPIISAILNVAIWFYGLYIGFKAYKGVEVEIPFMTEFLNKKNEVQPEIKKVKSAAKNEPQIENEDEESKSDGDEALKALKLRYAKGEITKRQFNKMKKDLAS